MAGARFISTRRMLLLPLQFCLSGPCENSSDIDSLTSFEDFSCHVSYCVFRGSPQSNVLNRGTLPVGGENVNNNLQYLGNSTRYNVRLYYSLIGTRVLFLEIWNKQSVLLLVILKLPQCRI